MQPRTITTKNDNEHVKTDSSVSIILHDNVKRDYSDYTDISEENYQHKNTVGPTVTFEMLDVLDASFGENITLKCNWNPAVISGFVNNHTYYSQTYLDHDPCDWNVVVVIVVWDVLPIDDFNYVYNYVYYDQDTCVQDFLDASELGKYSTGLNEGEAYLGFITGGHPVKYGAGVPEGGGDYELMMALHGARNQHKLFVCCVSRRELRSYQQHKAMRLQSGMVVVMLCKTGDEDTLLPVCTSHQPPLYKRMGLMMEPDSGNPRLPYNDIRATCINTIAGHASSKVARDFDNVYFGVLFRRTTISLPAPASR